jgi:DNA-binding SARP family transcriptional activator
VTLLAVQEPAGPQPMEPLPHGDLAAALDSALTRGNPVELGRLLDRSGGRVLAAGHVHTVEEAVRALPPAALTPARLTLLAHARQVRGDADGALESCRQAAGEPPAGEPTAAEPAAGPLPLPAGVAWRMGLVRYQSGQPTAALAAYARGRLDREDTLDEALLLAWSSTACWMLGDRAGCDRFAARAWAAASRSGDAAALAAAHSALALCAKLDEDRSANGRHWALALDAAQRAGDLLQEVRIRANRGSHLLEEGFPADAEVELAAAAQLAERVGFAAAVGLCHSNLGLCLLQLGRFGEAVAALERGKAAFQAVGGRMIVYALAGLGDAYRERGDLALARAAYEEAAATGDAEDPQAWVPAMSGLARVLAVHDLPAAWQLAGQALDAARDPERPRAELTLGWLHLYAGAPAQALELARRVAAAARPRRDRAALAEALELEALSHRDEQGHPDRQARWLLAEALSVWREIGHPVGIHRVRYALGRLFWPDGEEPGADGVALAGAGEQDAAELTRLGVRMPGPHAAGLLDAVARCAPLRVAVRVLGRFEILRDGVPVADTEWQSRKARELLKILLARRGRAVPRGRLVELLWPDEDEPDVLANRLSVALATIRRVLDPVRSQPANHYVVTEDGSVTLALHRIEVDVETFLRDATSGLRRWSAGSPGAVAQLRRAAAAYRGDVLEEDVYADWAHALREETRAAYLAVLRALADAAATAGDTDQAVLLLIRLLDHDPYDEPAHLAMVAALLAAGRYGDARRAHRAYAVRMAEIGVDPSLMPPGGRRRG